MLFSKCTAVGLHIVDNIVDGVCVLSKTIVIGIILYLPIAYPFSRLRQTHFLFYVLCIAKYCDIMYIYHS